MTPNFRLWTLDFLFVFLVAFYLSSRHFALGIGAASFASVVYGASKDRAESPTAKPERPKQLTVYN